MTLPAEPAAAGARGREPGTERGTMAIGEFLLRCLREAGVRHAFGVPGDFDLELLQLLVAILLIALFLLGLALSASGHPVLLR